jgi:hypothetical protein
MPTSGSRFRIPLATRLGDARNALVVAGQRWRPQLDGHGGRSRRSRLPRRWDSGWARWVYRLQTGSGFRLSRVRRQQRSGHWSEPLRFTEWNGPIA